MKKYTFQVVVTEGCDDFWESFIESDSTGCDEVLAEVRDALFDFTQDIKLVKYEDVG